MEQGSNNREEPLPCANSCGFFGSPATRNLCSKCFRLAEAHAVAATAVLTASSSSSAAASVDPEAAAPPTATEEEGKGKGRCAACGRKLGLMGFDCRCGGVFCGAHRYSDRHYCGYDYKGAGRDAIARANPVVRADKL